MCVCVCVVPLCCEPSAQRSSVFGGASATKSLEHAQRQGIFTGRAQLGNSGHVGRERLSVLARWLVVSGGSFMGAYRGGGRAICCKQCEQSVHDGILCDKNIFAHRNRPVIIHVSQKKSLSDR